MGGSGSAVNLGTGPVSRAVHFVLIPPGWPIDSIHVRIHPETSKAGFDFTSHLISLVHWGLLEFFTIVQVHVLAVA